ncbi:MAG: apolipoprotein N-acyltransferase [Desulfobacterales bacterium]|nr:apolipoprotein N-acyltransferase [Desulfobacterales bacterium]
MFFLPRLSILFPYFPALVSGFLLTTAFPDTGLYPLAFVALVPFWTALKDMAPKKAFYAGLLAGLAHYLTLIYWIVPTLTVFGKLHPVLAVASLLLLTIYLAFYIGAFAFIMKWMPAPHPFLTPFWGATVWIGLEFIRTHALTGFPWGVLGYSQYTNSLLIQSADLTGVLGISFLVVAVNGSLTLLWTALRSKSIEKRQAFISVAVTLFLIFGALLYGYLRLKTVKHWIQDAPHPSISVIQGNIEQDKKWDKAFKTFTIDQYTALSKTVLPSNLVIWPETALPFYYAREGVYSSRVDALVRQAKTHFLIGSPAAEPANEKFRYYNRAYMLTPLGMVQGTYDKTHLVPFGEYVPFQEILWFIDKLTTEAGNFSKGKTGMVPLEFGSHKTGVLICFEILFSDISRTFVQNGADILTTMTNDAWFGRTSAPEQHFSIAVLRAVENRRSLVRAANTGISGFIDPSGKIIARTQLFTPAALARKVPAIKQTTFFTRHGDIIGIAALVALGLSFMVKSIKNKFRRP